MTFLIILCAVVTYKVESVTISGNLFFSEPAIKKIMLTRRPTLFHKGVYVKEVLDGDIAAIKTLYANNGFLDARVDRDVTIDTTRKKVSIRILVDEGRQVFVATITFQGNTLFDSDTLAAIITQKPGSPLDKRKIDLDNYVLTSLYDDRGFANTRITSEYVLTEDRAHVIHRITESEKQYIDRVEFHGLRATDQKMLNRYVTLKSGDVFRFANVLESQRNLYNLGIFKSIRVHTKKALNANYRVVQFIFTEKEPMSVNFRLGYGTQDRIRIGAGFTHINMFGRAWQGTIEGKASFTEYRLNAAVTFPHLFFLPLGYSLGGFFQYKEEVSFTTRSFGAYNEIHYPLLIGRLSVKHEIEHVRTYQTPVDTVPDGLLHGVIFNWARDSRNDPFTPCQGYYVLLGLETSGIILPANTDYLRPTFEFRIFQPVNPLVIGGALKTGYVKEYAPTTSVPLHKRFYCGGTTSVRGFSEWSIGPRDPAGLPLGGTILGEASLECRIPIYNIIGSAVFLDVGNVWSDFNDLPGGIRYGAGVGIRLHTPLGSVRLDYGIKLNRYADESIGTLHFAIGEAF